MKCTPGRTCPDPEAAARPAVSAAPDWTELKKLIEELLEAKSVTLGYRSWAATSSARRDFRSADLAYVRLLESGVEPQAIAYSYRYARGDLEASEPLYEGTRLSMPAQRAGVFESSMIEAIHDQREQAPDPSKDFHSEGRGQSADEFRKHHREALKVLRLFAEVMPAIDMEYAARFSRVLHAIGHEMRTEWTYHPTVRADTWAAPVGSLKPTRDLFHSISFDMSDDKRRRLRELMGAASVQLPVLLFRVGQPLSVGQRGNVLADERLMIQLVSKLKQLPRGTGVPKFHVYGFADGSGRTDANRQLSERRAQWTIARLRQDYGLNLNLEASGCGDYHARARTRTKLNPKQRAVLLMQA